MTCFRSSLIGVLVFACCFAGISQDNALNTAKLSDYSEAIKQKLPTTNTGSSVVRLLITKDGKVDSAEIETSFLRKGLGFTSRKDDAQSLKELSFENFVHKPVWVEFTFRYFNLPVSYVIEEDKELKSLQNLIGTLYKEEVSKYYMQEETGEIIPYRIIDGRIVIAPVLTFSYSFDAFSTRANEPFEFFQMKESIPVKKEKP